MANILGVEALQEKVKLTINRFLHSRETLNEIGKLARDRIYSTVKSGYSMAGGEKRKIQPLSEPYKKYRKKFQEQAKTGNLFSPNRSNLTLTGQMLEALSFVITKSGRSVEIFVKDTLRVQNPYSFKTEESKTNAQVAQKVSDDGRPFIGLDTVAIQRIRNELVKDLRKALRVGGLRK